MQSKSHGQMARVLGIYDFSPFGTIGDIGGGYGHLLQAVLRVAPRSVGVLFELPNVIDQVSSIASERLRLQAGDFFVDALPVCDAYVLMQVIHDWGDKEAATILAAGPSCSAPARQAATDRDAHSRRSTPQLGQSA